VCIGARSWRIVRPVKETMEEEMGKLKVDDESNRHFRTKGRTRGNSHEE
jgi:hypothetical protein